MSNQKPPSEKDERIQMINNSLNTIENLKTQISGMSAQMGMIQGNLNNLAQGLQENVQWLISQHDLQENKIKELLEALKPIKEEKDIPEQKDEPTQIN